MPVPREYEVVLTPERGGYSVAVPALPGCASRGETREQALTMVREAIEAYLESLEAHGDPIPGPIEIERVKVGANPSSSESTVEGGGIMRNGATLRAGANQDEVETHLRKVDEALEELNELVGDADEPERARDEEAGRA
jgi:predicted RNase H-like HicB family nuclease